MGGQATTKEQEESIENIKIYIHDWINESVDEDGYERYAIEEYDKEFMNDIETVLSMLKEKDRQIDLMSEELIGVPIDNKNLDWEHPYRRDDFIFLDSKEEIKQYFERKSENGN